MPASAVINPPRACSCSHQHHLCHHLPPVPVSTVTYSTPHRWIHDSLVPASSDKLQDICEWSYGQISGNTHRRQWQLTPSMRQGKPGRPQLTQLAEVFLWIHGSTWHAVPSLGDWRLWNSCKLCTQIFEHLQQSCQMLLGPQHWALVRCHCHL